MLLGWWLDVSDGKRAVEQRGERHGDVRKPGRQREEVRQRAGAAQPFLLRVCLSASV